MTAPAHALCQRVSWAALALLAACGGEASAPDTTGSDDSNLGAGDEEAAGGDRDVEPPVTGGPGQLPVVSSPQPDPAPGPPTPSKPPTRIGSAEDVACVALPPIEPRRPTESYADSCGAATLTTTPDSVSSDSDARSFLVGRWELCGGDALFGETSHSGLEFGANGRIQLLDRTSDGLAAAGSAPTASFTLLPSGQFMLHGALSLDDYAVFARFDANFDALEFDAFGTTLRYARVAPNVASAAANIFSTADASCSMAGVWDTAVGSENPAAAFAFDAEGQWIGGERGANLCDQHFMYGTYELSADGFHLVTNVGTGACDYWFDAYFGASFSADCNQVTLNMSGDNCTGGRGYLNYPGDVLIRRQPSR